jgi:RNA polymerase sigma factor (sigma-70 family)
MTTEGVAVAAGTDVEFSTFYRSELDAQVRRAFLMLGDNDAANDIVHEAMVGVFKRWVGLDQPAAYLNRAVLNGCRDAGRRRVSSGRMMRRLGVRDVSESPSDTLSDVLAQLPFNHRAAVVLRFYGGFTTNEIAEALGCAPGSVGPWIDRGLAAMRKVLS